MSEYKAGDQLVAVMAGTGGRVPVLLSAQAAADFNDGECPLHPFKVERWEWADPRFEALERTKGNLAALQRDRDALAAEVRDVDQALRDTGLEHHIPTGQGLNKDTRRLAIECSAAAVEEQIQITEALRVERDALAARVRELEAEVQEREAHGDRQMARTWSAFDRFADATKALKARGAVLDTIEVTVEHGGEELTLDVEITRWATRATHTHPPEGAEWEPVNPAEFYGFTRRHRDAQVRIIGSVHDQVQAHCAERAAPGREG